MGVVGRRCRPRRPAVASWAANEMQVFAIWRDGQLWDIYWDGAAWHECMHMAAS